MDLSMHPGTSRPQRLLYEGLLASSAAYPDKTAIVIGDKSYSYAELLNAALCLAASLQEAGVKRGDRVAIYMDNTWPCVVSIYGALFAGAVFLTINPQTKSAKLKYILKDSGANALITDSHLAKVFTPILPDTKNIITLILSGENNLTQYSDPPTQYFEQIISDSKYLSRPVEVIPNDLATLIYTSGSSGFPKGVMQTHQSMVFAAWSLIEYLRLSSSDRILLVLPLAFDYGLYQLLMSVNLAATLVVERSFTFPAVVYKTIVTQAVTIFPAVPTILAMMIASHKKKALIFPTITRLTNTAAALAPALIPDLHEIFPNALIYKMYGLTECKRVCYLEPEMLDSHPDSVGRAIPGTETFLLNSEGDPVAVGDTGILYVRGPHIMAGYWNQPEFSRKMLKPGALPGERILCTQDLFKQDENQLLYFIGRNDDMIKTRGEKVSPVEVENVLQSIPGIHQASIVGIDDESLGQAIQAFVVLNPGAELSEREIRKICLSRLENFMVPKVIVFLERLPKTSNGKIDRIDLKNRAAHG